ncbi:lipopolysaccharide heptosyltransferase I [Helicobacter turcicus]|uniref:Lipopolysaccharide heptosyltransferase 1 n=1 Tax=Helicobacter turcicus TaxID=2867412 RepID=A0ABS7JLU9_9HELI|nr:lipopolysaccharide heptosyltransferase I [Helicobacter turcicus]MBX7490365.1 lipopolysaccharide heptosyltransferase I [Helicobacter turcicus]MBX7545056.1 lipopolysaccharide heptosyltransferase I [Helicobacter turcicus]
MPQTLNLAIVRLSAMGDIIHTASILPSLFDALKERYTLHLNWIIDSTFSAIMEDSPYINRLIPLPLKEAIKTKDLKTLLAMHKALKTESFDIVLDMQGLLKSALIAKTLNAQSIFGFQSPKESLAKLFYTKSIAIPYSSHILLRNATLAFGTFGLPIPSLETLKSPKDFLGFKSAQFPFISSIKNKKILCVLETSKPNKTYPLEKFLELTKLLNAKGYTPIFLSQKPITIPQNAQFYHIHSLDLAKIKSLVAQMDLVIGGDTGITHLAWALKRPSITLFGSTPRERFNLDTPQNLSLSANTNNDKNNFNIATLDPSAIFELTQSLLEKSLSKTFSRNNL